MADRLEGVAVRLVKGGKEYQAVIVSDTGIRRVVVGQPGLTNPDMSRAEKRAAVLKFVTDIGEALDSAG